MRYEFNWQAAGTYSYLDDVGSTGFAWEFLRRNSDYQEDYQSIASQGDAAPEMPEPLARRWGLRFAADPDLRADRAHIVWLPHFNPATVVVAPAPDEFTDARSISALTPAFSRHAANGEHWLLDHGSDALPVALMDGVGAARPAAVVIPLDGGFTTRVAAAHQLWDVLTGRTQDRTPNGLTEQQRSRLRSILRALDGLLAGGSYRAIAAVLFGPDAVPAGREWAAHELRGRVRRLCNRGMELMRGEYLSLLRQPREFHG